MKRGFVIISLLLMSAAAFPQELRLVVFDKPLNTVLNTLGVEISFDDKALSGYMVTVSKTFKTPEEAIEYLLKDKPFKMEKVGSVYVISPALKTDPEPVKKKYVISGELTDRSSGEPLPYAHIQTDRGMATTDESGRFSVTVESDQPVRLQAQYIGYGVLDTLLGVGNHAIGLSAKPVLLGEVVVRPSPSAMLMQSGSTSGEVRINHQIASYMPGSADNSIFNLLRMIPGVRASGEPSEDLIVWGSNWGESKLMYDGFTIFGMKSFNDQISSVNPYMVKDIRLMKGGYDASFGNRIGAVAEITGNEGDFNKPSVKANISNYTANLFASVPVRKTAALSVAYRQTFYNLYDGTSLGGGNDEHGKQTSSGILISPKYDFKDLNVKYAGKAFGNDRYHVSLYGADDRFKFSVKRQAYELDAAEKNKQYGASAGYNRAWNDGSSSKLLFSFSKFSGSIDNVSGITGSQSTPPSVFHIDNSIQEAAVNLEHNINIGKRQQLQIGGKWQQYANSFNGEQTQINNPALYVTGRVMLGKLSIQAGLRADWIVNSKIYIQPRVSARYAFTDELTATASFGLYNQFLSRVPYQYSSGSYQMVWSLADSTFLSSTHWLAGLAYSKSGWLFSAEGYVKQNRNEWFFFNNAVSPFDNNIKGVDVYIRKEWRKQTFFGSYSVVNASKPETTTGQEIKLGAITTFKNFHFSATYVYGAGFTYLSTGNHGHGQENGHGQGSEQGQHGSGHSDTSASSTEPYSRFDVSLAYRLQLKKCRIQAGASVLNVFDTDNIKYSYRIADQNNVYNIYTKATPLTPIIFFEIIF